MTKHWIAGVHIAALLAPFAFALPQQWLIPSWFEASLLVAEGLFFVHFAAVCLVVRAIARRREWGRIRRIVLALLMGVVAFSAVIVTLVGGTRDGFILCGRRLDEVVACPGGGEAYSFTELCVAGNPDVQVEVRSSRLPFMHRVSARSARDACNALEK